MKGGEKDNFIESFIPYNAQYVGRKTLPCVNG